MFSCLLEARFSEVLLEGTAVCLVFDAAASGFDKSAPALLLEGVIDRACNTSTNEHITNLACSLACSWIKGNIAIALYSSMYQQQFYYNLACLQIPKMTKGS